MDAHELARLVKNRLSGLDAYVYYQAVTGSVYIKFGDKKLRSLRIGDHEGRAKYSYKWNLRRDCQEFRKEVDRGATRFYYPWSEWKALCEHIENYALAIESNKLKVRRKKHDLAVQETQG